MKNILVSAYCVSPTRGSEYAVAWDYITRMSKYHRLTVLYGISGDQMGDTTELENFTKKSPLDNVRFISVGHSKTTIALNFLNRHNIFPFTYYLAFNNWQKSAYRVAKQLVKSETFDLVHMLGPIGYREPGYLWKLELPYVWGPIGGVNNYPIQLLKATYSFKGKLFFLLRTFLNKIQLNTSFRVRKALKKSNILLTATTENQQNILQAQHAKSKWLPENGITGEVRKASNSKFSKQTINLVWIGRIDDFKAIILLLKALERLPQDNFVLHVIGDGFIKKEMEQYTIEKGINHLIKWHGKIARSEVFSILSQAHLHIITSLGEANTTVIWEAMSLSVPTMTLDHCGMHDVVCDKCGIKIPIVSYEQIIEEISAQLQKLMNHPELLKKLSEGVAECAQAFQWDKREAFWNEIYDEAITNFKQGITSTSSNKG